jgi:hypothetical protein
VFAEFIPDDLAQALWVLRARPETIDEKQTDPASQEVVRFGNELPHDKAAALGPR